MKHALTQKPAGIKRWALALLLILLVNIMLTTSFEVAHAYPVPPLPPDNLIVNPWFRSGNMAGFSGWTLPLNEEGLTWGPSQKESNPSPDIVVSGTCGGQAIYCGTAARWAEQEKIYYPNVDVFGYQVVATDPSNRKLTFFTYYVSHRVEIGAVNIYGGESATGPWEYIWSPLYHSQSFQIVPESGEIRDLWEETGFVEKVLEQGFPYYKVELQSRLPELPHDMIRGGGFKITGIYFSTAFTDEPPSTGSLVPQEPDSSEVEPSPAIPGTAESTEGAVDTPVAPVAPSSRETPEPETTIAATEVAEVAESQEANAQGELTLSAEAISATEVSITLSLARNRRVRLERSLDGTTGWRPVTTLEPGATEYVDSGLTPNTIHYYRVRVSQNETSEAVSVQTVPLLEPKSPPVATVPVPAEEIVEVPAQQPEAQVVDAGEVPNEALPPSPVTTSTTTGGVGLSETIYLLVIGLIVIVCILVLSRLVWLKRRHSH